MGIEFTCKSFCYSVFLLLHRGLHDSPEINAPRCYNFKIGKGVKGALSSNRVIV